MVEFEEATSTEQFDQSILLFKEYASQLDVDLSFQNFDQEIEEIHLQYSRPQGLIYIAYDNSRNAVGCFGIRKFSRLICELKRMYLKEEMRGLGIGKVMMSEAINAAKELGYIKMRLDTLPTMEAAIKLYTKFGFYEIDPHRFNPVKGTKYFELELE